MTIRNLDATLAPKSIALIGASERESSVGRIVLDNVRAGFGGAIYPVNPKYDTVRGLRCYRRIGDLPDVPEVAVVMTPAQAVPRLMDELGGRGCKAAVVLSAGIGSANGLRQAMLDAAKPHLLRLIGPNTIGLIAPRVNLNASFTHLAPARGRLGLISQSGAIVSSMIDWAVAEGVGFSQIYSLGDMSDVDLGDCLDILALDDQTDAILIYAEAITNPRKFMSAARAASRTKPVIAVKPGRHAEAAKAAATHTGALAGADRVVDAVLRRAGILRVNDIEDLFDAAEVMGRYRPLATARTAIVTNGGGAGVLAVDELLDRGGLLAALSHPTVDRLNEALPPTWSHANPIDIIGDAPPERYSAAIRAAGDDEGVDALLVMNCPTGIADPIASAQAVVDLARHGMMNGKPVLTCWLGSAAATPARALLQKAGVGSFDSPAHAAEGVALLTRWSKLRAQLEQVPSDEVPATIDAVRIRQVLDAVAADKRTILTEPEAKTVLAGLGIAVPETVTCATEADVERAAEQLLTRWPRVVVKLLSRQITHKSDVGGVMLDLSTASDARRAALAIRERVTTASPSALLDGFTVQPMIDRSDARELLAGLASDPSFGPVVAFGAGGTAVEVIDDTAIGVAPLDAQLAADMVGRTRISKLLEGYRDVPAVDMAAVISVLVALSQLSILFPEISSVDVNPLLASADGVTVLDARIVVHATRRALAAPNPGLIIRPYPSGEESKAMIEGAEITLRPIRPSDATLYPRFMQRMDAEDLRRRFLTPMAALSRPLLVRLTQLDYDRDMAFVALEGPDRDLAGIVRYSADPDHVAAEYGILVRSDLKGRGLGRTMMRRLIDFARRDGIAELFGMILPDNERMLAICRDLGFKVEERVPGENLVRASLSLRT